MRTDFLGQLANAKLKASDCLSPVFEAIANSLFSLEEAKAKPGRIEVRIDRDQRQGVLQSDQQDARQITGFSIIDNGIGFTEANFQSFETLNSRYRQSRGGKGIGRVLWLKAFERTEIESRYQENGKHYQRTFQFIATESGVDQMLKVELKDSPERKTVVRLIGYKRLYADACPKTLDAIVGRIIEHAIEHLVKRGCPTLIVSDDAVGAPVDLNQRFRDEMLRGHKSESFRIEGKDFKISHFRLREGIENDHKLHLCAHDRVVHTERLSKHVVDLRGPTLDPELNERVVYQGYVSSPFLDERVNLERTGFDLISADGLALPDELPLESIIESSMKKVQRHVEPLLVPAREEKKKRFSEFVRDRPQFRAVAKHRPELIEQIPANATPEKLEIEFYRADMKYDIELKEKKQELLTETAESAGGPQAYREKFERFIEQWNDRGLGNLALYVAHRGATLALLEDRMGRGADGKYALEDAVHEIIFPLKATSDDVRLNEQNLWIIDEILSYHRFLASDTPLKKAEPLVNTSKDRPDIVVFNQPFAFAEEDHGFSSIVLVEFKRPVRDDYDDTENPLKQVTSYVRTIRDGKAKTRDGRPINVPDGTPFYCYIVADVTKSLREQAEERSLTPTADAEGYFGYIPALRAYVEIMSFTKLLGDAKKRNAVLFEKLNMQQ